MAKRAPKEPLLNYAFRCKVCALRFKVRMRASDPDPKCPNVDCGASQTPIGMDVGGGRAPGIGGNVAVKAMDMTQNMVASQYGMTDLNSVREGEVMAPKLPPAQQAQADAFFDPGARARLWGQTNPMNAAINQIAGGGIAAAAAAAKSNPQSGGIDSLSAIHNQRYKPKINLF